MIERQMTRYDATSAAAEDGDEAGVLLGSQIIHAAVDFDTFLAAGLGRAGHRSRPGRHRSVAQGVAAVVQVGASFG